MKKKLGAVFLCLCMLFALCVPQHFINAMGVYKPIDDGGTITATEVTEAFTDADEVTLDFTGTSATVTGCLEVPSGKKLTIKGTGLNTVVTMDKSEYGSIHVLSGGNLDMSNLTVKAAGSILTAEGRANIAKNVTLSPEKGYNITAQNGGNVIVGAGVTINSSNTKDYLPLEAKESSKITLKGQGFGAGDPVTLNYSTAISTQPFVGNVELGEYVMIKDMANQSKDWSEIKRLAFANQFVSDGTVLMNKKNDDDKTYPALSEYMTIPTSYLWAYTDSVGFSVEAIALKYAANLDVLMPAVLEYSKIYKQDVNIDLLRNVQTKETYKVLEGQSITLNTSYNTGSSAGMQNYTIESINEASDGGAAFYVNNGKLTITGLGSIIGARTGIYSGEGFPNSEVVLAGTYTKDINQTLTFRGKTHYAIHMYSGNLTIQRGNFVAHEKNSLELSEDVKTNITGGTYKEDIQKYLSDGYVTRLNVGSDYTVVKSAGKDWWNPNGAAESANLHVYNRGLATTTNKNPIVWEVNGGASATGIGNVLAKTIPTTTGATYTYDFDYTNRTNGNTSQDENTLIVYAYPGVISGNITDDIVAKSVKLGDYYGNDTSWVHASGEFKASSEMVTFFIKTKQSSGLGGIIDKNSATIEQSDAYALTDVNSDNVLQSGNFASEDGWSNLDTEGGLEFSSSVSTYTNASKTPAHVAEANASHPSVMNALNQTFTTVPQSRIQVSFDLVKRKNMAGDEDNRVAVYIVDATKVKTLNDLDNYKPVATIVGNATNWQSASFEYSIPKDQTKSMIVFKALTKAGGGIILGGVSVKSLAWEPKVEKITDKALTVTAYEKASYQLYDGGGNKVGSAQTSSTFTGLKPGTKYKVGVTITPDAEKFVEGITTKYEAPKASDTTPVKVLAVGVNSIAVETANGQEYSTDGGKTWTSDTGKFVVLKGLNSKTAYTISTRKAETFDIMPGEIIQTANKTTTNSVVTPVVNERTANTITLTAVIEQEYSIDNGTTWVNPKSTTLRFSDLKENTKYSILTRVKANTYFEASETKSVEATTKITVTGKLEGDDFPATITITDKKTGKVVAVITTDENGNWKADLDLGQYDYRAEGKNKKESFDGVLNVEAGKTNTFNSKMDKFKSVKTFDTTTMILPVMGVMISVAVVYFVLKKKKSVEVQ